MQPLNALININRQPYLNRRHLFGKMRNGIKYRKAILNIVKRFLKRYHNGNVFGSAFSQGVLKEGC